MIVYFVMPVVCVQVVWVKQLSDHFYGVEVRKNVPLANKQKRQFYRYLLNLSHYRLHVLEVPE
jgi:hypothetical protein